ncbi:MAG: hypothetical protein EA349_10940 [Halomonadaceae bacterium]|nr:MAG: hypothetical protein EA349_10940 [Halomonadaceae bacterium]
MDKRTPFISHLLPLLLLLSGCVQAHQPAPLAPFPTQGLNLEDRIREGVTVTRYAYGIPHIQAANFAGMGYGFGYIQAKDNLCLLAENRITLRGLRSRFWGAEEKRALHVFAGDISNLDSDIFWRHMATEAVLASLRDHSDQEAMEASAGFVNGYNSYLAEIRSGQHPERHAHCRDAPWLQPMQESDLYRRFLQAALISSSGALKEEVTQAEPTGLLHWFRDLTGSADPSSGNPSRDSLARLAREQGLGSNMLAVSGQASRNGQPLLFANPHFPWQGINSFTMAHLTVNGRSDLMGATLQGLPLILMGFNRELAWSHTVSPASRFTFYELQLHPLNPTRYRYEGEYRDMHQHLITIPVLEDDGSVSDYTRLLYSSHYGPMLTLDTGGVPLLGWNPFRAYTLRDVNLENPRMINQFLRWAQAGSYQEFIDLHQSVLGLPWVHTLATGPGQPVYYGEISAIPNVPDTLARECATRLSSVITQVLPGLALLDGSRKDCEWASDPDAPAKGIFGPGNLPHMEHPEWAHNCNDSHWLSNPRQPLTGFAAIIGEESSPRSLRTRECMTRVVKRLEGSDGLPGAPGFDRQNLKEVVLNTRQMSERLARQQVLHDLCRLSWLPGSDGRRVQIRPACKVLARWNGLENPDSRGAHLWREFWRRLEFPVLQNVKQQTAGGVWWRRFRPEHPMTTPSGLATLNPVVFTAFADAIRALEDNHIPLDAPLGDIQVSGVHPQPIPIAGGEGFSGAYVIASERPADLSSGGYQVNYGNSYLQLVSWDEQGNPVAEGFLTNSLSSDPASPHFQDMTEAYSRQQWVPFAFTPEQQAADPKRRQVHLTLPGD